MEEFVCVDADIMDVAVAMSAARAMSNPHSHDYYEVYCFLGEEMTFFLESTPITLRTDDILLVNKHLFHMTTYKSAKDPLAKSRRANISFNAGFLHKHFDGENVEQILSLFRTPLLTDTNKKARKEHRALFEAICAGIQENTKVSILKSYHQLCVLLIGFLEDAKSFRAVTFEDAASPEENRVAHIARYINMHYSEDITLTSLAKEFYVSKHFLSHSFKNIVGVGITEFINRKRVNEAANLLDNTNMSLTDISGLVGFNSQPYFNKTFHQYHAVSPGKYRMRHGGLREYCERVSDLHK